MKMAAEKHSSKSGGGYVGGLLQLFDWNAKSRKKLFSSKSSPEQSKQKKRCNGNLPTTQFQLMGEDEFVAGSSIRGSDYSCASSMTDEEFNGAKAPSVVARLMGLDSMPTSNFSEPYATPYFVSQSLQGVDSHSRALDTRSNGPVRSVLEPKPMSRPFEKFQTEMLPPKSAKSIALTHHKLLSPIKRANYIPSENAAHIMEAAARIIGPGPSPPQTTKAKVKLSSVGSSSAPLKIRDLKEKVEASQTQRPLKGKRTSSADSVSSRVSSDSEECSSSMKGKGKCKGKSISLALQAKANVQKRGGVNSRSSEVQKESSEVTSNETFRSQASTHSNTQRKSSTPGVLRQNNLKQNCSAEKGKSLSKPSVATSQGRKTSNVDSSFLRGKSSSKNAASSKVASRRSKAEVSVGKREEASSNNENISSKKRSIDGNLQSEKNRMKNEKLNASGLLMDRESSIFGASKRKGTDVISFTFTAPMTGSFAHSTDTFREVSEKNDLFSADFRGKRSLLNSGATNSTKFTLSGNNVIGGDALSALLEQKLRELSRGMESPSPPKAGTSESSSLFLQDSSNKSIEKHSPGFSSADLQGFIMKHKLQVTMDQDMDNSCRNNVDVEKLLEYRLPSPVSVLEQTVFAESCNSSDTFDSFYTGGSKQSSLVQAQEVLNISCMKKPHPMEVETDLLDSASSLSYAKTGQSTNWELEYVKDILCNVELMFADFAMGRSRKVINPHLFDQLETRKWELNRHEPKLTRKAIFDCVAECMDIRCKHYASGGCKTWIKGMFAVTSKERLAEEVYREISGWNDAGDCMVDELVDKDMSNKHGAWLDFEIEAFELGVQIENRILNHLLDEVIADILVL